ncbi:prepilin-type N-terminal cleavage/methylation domain-containing protein [Moellerella wisconsensis]|uniref:Prepilin peptidase-dependent protein A n=1 Tax=Moellerella wisconsensis ATCC 35017 TaxID=1354267 RepID=A0A0N0IC11_9GAMM|nr:prepilin-type N-terminal cleavage/methylation domain-containing protein [Moellerella wisconsensis]KPD04392.1 prepilin peptidase-dependent protein A [Moellerella wisconsensis ATCC 35017]VFS52698.1 Tfp pilus assembly protein FimT [Moellerella wisconsensis]
MKSRQNGFTLIEVMVVLLILSLILSSGLYGWHHQQQQIRLLETVRRVADFIDSQLTDAIYLNDEKILKISISSEGEPWKLEVHSKAGTQSYRSSFADQFSDVLLITTNRSDISFYGKQGTTHGFSLTFENEAGRALVVVSSLGRVRICSIIKRQGVSKC